MSPSMTHFLYQVRIVCWYQGLIASARRWTAPVGGMCPGQASRPRNTMSSVIKAARLLCSSPSGILQPKCMQAVWRILAEESFKLRCWRAYWRMGGCSFGVDTSLWHAPCASASVCFFCSVSAPQLSKTRLGRGVALRLATSTNACIPHWWR